MPRFILLAFLALAGCSDAERDAASPAVASASLAGLYERAGVPGRSSRICISGDAQAPRFGIVTSSEGPASCTAIGRVRRNGSTLALLIDGDPACALSATSTSTGMTLDAATGADCAYYCGDGASLDPGSFAKVGGTAADARRAVDAAGEPLCPG